MHSDCNYSISILLFTMIQSWVGDNSDAKCREILVKFGSSTCSSRTQVTDNNNTELE